MNTNPLTTEDVRPYRHCKPVTRLFKDYRCYVGNIRDIILQDEILYFHVEPIIRFDEERQGLFLCHDKNFSEPLITNHDTPIRVKNTPQFEVFKLENVSKFIVLPHTEGRLYVNSKNIQAILSFCLQDVYAVNCFIQRHTKVTH